MFGLLRFLAQVALALLAFVIIARTTSFFDQGGFLDRLLYPQTDGGGWGGTLTGNVDCILPRGRRLASGDSIIAYQNPLVSASHECTKETRTCTAGKLNGSYQHPTCKVYVHPPKVFPPGKSCSTPRKSTVVNWDYVIAYRSSTSENEVCQAQKRVCRDGILDGSYTHKDCKVQLSGPAYSTEWYTVANPPKGLPLVEVNPKKVDRNLIQPPVIDSSKMTFNTEGKRVPRLTENPNERDNSNTDPRLYDDLYTDPSTDMPKEELLCTAPRWEMIKQGETLQAYPTFIGFKDNPCKPEMRLCNEWILQWSAQFPFCDQRSVYTDQFLSNIHPDNAQIYYNNFCQLPRKTVIKDWESAYAFEKPSVQAGESCVWEIRTCSRGVLGGQFQYKQCVISIDN
jgi:hypothetical protein